MATSSFAMQSLLVGSPFSSSTTRLNHSIIPVNQTSPRQMMKANMRSVKCMAAEDDKKEVLTPENLSQSPSISPPPPPPPAPKVSTKFEDLLAFGGPAPERINGRLAMLGFVAAIGVELANGQDLFSQISEGGGFTWFVGSSVVLSLASLIPLFKGVRAEAKSSGLMTSDAELWNGRFAMLGLVALAFTEYLKGGAFV